MEIEYDGSKYDSIIARSPEDAVRKYKKEMDEQGVSYCGIVATERHDIDATNRHSFIVRAIAIDSVME